MHGLDPQRLPFNPCIVDEGRKDRLLYFVTVIDP